MGAANKAVRRQTGAKGRTALCAEDWEHGALEVIAEAGIRALTVESLARRLGITKGSFYWHFANREALLERALTRWEAIDARNLRQALSDIACPRDRLRRFFRRTSREKLTHRVYSALCVAGDHELVAPLLERVATRRMEHLAVAYRELGYDEDRARHRSRLAYSAYLGFLQLQRQRQAPNLSSEDFDAYVEHVIETLIPA